jgi:hypothetical protein
MFRKGSLMNKFENQGFELRTKAKSIVLAYMKSVPDCAPGQDGMRLSEIFRNCGFDWGPYPNATSSNQQYWVVALMRELQAEGKVERVEKSGPWRLK